MIRHVEQAILNEQALNQIIVVARGVAMRLREQSPHGFAQRNAEGGDERRPLVLKPIDRPPRMAEAAQDQIGRVDKRAIQVKENGARRSRQKITVLVDRKLNASQIIVKRHRLRQSPGESGLGWSAVGSRTPDGAHQ